MSYLTIARPAEAEIEVKRSRFLCTLARVEDEAAARAVVERLRKQHWDARHYCSAFVLGPDGRVERSSDDGEPAGTAGAPGCVMNAINDALRPLGAAPLTDMPFTPGKILRALGKI